jgi:hypothetical protein
MNKFGDFLEKVFDGGMYLLMVGAFFVAAVIIFIFVGGVVGIIFNNLTTGVVIGFVVTIAIIYALYAIGKRIM